MNGNVWLRAILAAVLLAAVLAPVAPAAAQEGPFGPQAYLPVVVQEGPWAGASAGFATTLVASAVDAPVATSPYRLRLHRGDGSVAFEADGFRYGQTYLPHYAIPPGRYAGVVLSSLRSSVTVNLAGGSPPGGAGHQAPTTPALELAVPNVFKNYFGYSSVISVQHAGIGGTAEVIVNYVDQAGNAVEPLQVVNIPANAFVDLPLGPVSLPDGFVGSVYLRSSHHIVAATHIHGPAGEMAGAAAASDGAARVALPAVYKSYSPDGWISSVLVQNLDASPAPVRITFRGSGLAAPVVLEDTIPPRLARQYWQGNAPAGLPDGFAGSAVVEATGGQRLVALVNTRNARGHFSSYAGTPSATGAGRELRFGDLYNAYSALGWTSSVVVQNADATEAAPITVAYYNSTGDREPVRSTTATLPPGEARLFYLPHEGLPAGFRGIAVVSATGGRIAGIANHLAVGQAQGDGLLTVEALTAA
jgi:hypothetical protein